jgi:PTS system fructose-specific IIC component
MRFVAVTACPTGVAHTMMAAEALRRQAEVMGHSIQVETQGAEGARQRLTDDNVARADAVIIAADIHVDPSRFAGKPVNAVSTAEAIRHTRDVINLAANSANDPGEAVLLPEPAPEPAGPAVVDLTAGDTKRLVAITSCPTGIAHTFMAAEGLRKGAASLGHVIKVETQGSVGAKDVLTADDVAAADAVIIAADTKVDLSRFVGKPVYETGTKDALKHGDDVVLRALSPSTPTLSGDGGSAGGSGPPATGGGGREAGALKVVYQHMMTGVSHMLPFIVAGGLLIALAFAFDIDANDPANADSFAGRLFQIGGAAFALFLPVLAGYIAYSIADRPGIAPGFIGGFLANVVETGFLGAILAGFAAGYLTLWLAQNLKLPQSLAGLKPVLILPLLSSLAIGLLMFYVIGSPVSWLQDTLTDWLQDLQGSNAALLGAVLGLMMAFDLGGPLNKVAYTFGVGLIASGVEGPMAAVMAAGMTPPLALALATFVARSRWSPDEREAGKPAVVLGLAFITEGAIPFAARHPARIIPACMAGSAVAGALSLGLGASMIVPHGGVFLLFVPGAVEKPLVWLLAILVGTLVSTAALLLAVRAPAVEGSAAPALPATA